MTNVQRDELLIQIVKEIGSFKEETKKGFLNLEKKIEDTEERLNKKIKDTEEKLDKKFTEKIANTKNEFSKKIEDTKEELSKNIKDTEEKLDKKLTEKIVNTKGELSKKIEDSKEYLKGKIDETGSIAGKLFKETWDKEYKRNVEIDSKIVDINKKLKTK